MEDNKILISVLVERKKYYNEDVLKAIIKDGELVFKNGFNFVQVNVFEHQNFFREYIKMIQQNIDEYNKIKREAEKNTQAETSSQSANRNLTRKSKISSKSKS